MGVAARSSSLFPDGSVFCVDREDNCVRRGRGAKPPNHQSFDVAVIEFDNDGSFADRRQLGDAADCIKEARRSNPNGALVVVFAHGWHHDASWKVDEYRTKWDAKARDDDHFREFRRVLMSLTLREAERYRKEKENDLPLGRRVVGVYFGWHGDPRSWIGSRLSRTWVLTHWSFYNRYRVAEAISAAEPIREAIRAIVGRTKDPVEERPDQPESPLILSGHSMGALMLESALLAILREGAGALVRRRTPRYGVEVKSGKDPVSFPDVILGLNSAADSRIAKDILAEFERLRLSKTVDTPKIRYAPPLIVSMTARADWITRVIWRHAQALERLFSRLRSRRGPERRDGPLFTDGHDPSLFTHDFGSPGTVAKCPQKLDPPDFKQDWHCLRHPKPRVAPTPAFAVDLPYRSRTKRGGPIHRRYHLTPRDPGSARLMWVFQVPRRMSKGHNDIFNFRSRLLVMALMQISGAVMSLAEDFDLNFEEEEP